jgi:hypothetical protein
MNIAMIVDTMWVMLAAILVFFMNLGFAAVESGMARSKNTVNILSKNFIVFAVSSLGFMLLGWGLMFGGDNPLIGTQHLWIFGENASQVYADTLTSNVPLWGKVFFQLVFCGTAATIVSGAVAERIKYLSFIIFSFVLTLAIYPIVGHWIWGGGWLSQLGFLDFAGDTVVHSVGGWAALAGAMILGPRIGKYGKRREAPGNSGPQHVACRYRSVCALARLVRIQSRLYHELSASGGRRARSDDDEFRSHCGGAHFYDLFLDIHRQAGSRHDHQRVPGRLGGDYRELRLCFCGRFTADRCHRGHDCRIRGIVL